MNTGEMREVPVSEQTDNGKILVVDDEQYVRELLREMLGSMGLEVIEAIDGYAGIDAFNSDPENIAACVIDLSMPGMTGIELLDQIRQSGSGVPVMLISGYARHEVRQKESSSPSVVFLQKPFSFEQFQSTMQAQLDG